MFKIHYSILLLLIFFLNRPQRGQRLVEKNNKNTVPSVRNFARLRTDGTLKCLIKLIFYQHLAPKVLFKRGVVSLT